MSSANRELTIKRQITEYNHPDAHIRLEKLDSVVIPCQDGTGSKEYRCFGAEATYKQLYFFDPVTQDWIYLPVAWELHRSGISDAVQILTTEFPNWTNLIEIILALRFNNYDVQKTMEWKRAELVAEKSFADVKDKAEAKSTGTDMQDVTAAEAVATAKLHAELTEAKEQNLKLQEEIKISKQEVEKLRAVNVKQQAQNEELGTNLGRYRARIEELEAALKAKSEEETNTSRVNGEVQKQKLDSCTFSVQELKAAYENLKKEFQSLIPEFKIMLQRAHSHTKIMVAKKYGSVEEFEKLRDLYEMESLKRKILYNKLQEMRGSIRVICRCRKDDRVDSAISFPSQTELSFKSKFRGHKTFQFDRVYGPESTQSSVYEEVSPSIRSCLDGYNVCILAYGQTGSGKTHTMMGTSEEPGVIRQAVKDLIENAAEDSETKFSFQISMMEIYNEKICDLLNPYQSDETFRIHIRHKNEVDIEGLTRQPFSTLEEVFQMFNTGAQNRHVAATLLNSTSSRSHMIVTIYVKGENSLTDTVTNAKLNLVDLAGSERVAQSGSTGLRFTEAASINKSLVCLGLVFQALRQRHNHVPYRNSKLTYALQDSLGGNAKATVFVNVSPAKSNLILTESTLNFGTDVGAIELGPIHQHKALKKKRLTNHSG